MSTESAAPIAAPAQPAPAVQPAASSPAAPAAPAAQPTPAVLQLVVPPTAPVVHAPAQPAAPVADPDKEPEKEPEKEPGWLKARMDRDREAQRKAYLKSLGVESEDDLKAALDARKAQEEAKKSIEQKALETSQALEAERKRVAEYQTALKGVADGELAKLTEPQRAAVVGLAGDDPTRILASIRALAPTWAAPPPPASAAPVVAQPVAAAPAAPAAPAPVAPAAPMFVQMPNGQVVQVVPVAPAPAAAPAPPATGTQAIPPTPISTAPAPGGPPPSAAPPVNAYEHYQALRKSAPGAAAEFLHKNASAIERDMPKR